MPLKRATTLRLIRHIGFDDSYENVVLFDSEEAQSEYFMGQIGLGFEEHSYQRPEANYVKVQAAFDDVHRYSYLMFRNASHQTKWWYAFIDSVEYINDNTTGIRFHIDIMQSYMFNYKLGESFVVREHSETDEPGDNLVPESLYFGEYEYDEAIDQLEVDASKCAFSLSGTLTAEDMCIVIAYNPAIIDLVSAIEGSGYLWKENMYGGVYQGVRFICLPFAQSMGDTYIDSIIADLDAILGSLDFTTFGGVMGAFMMPIIFLPPQDEPSWTNVRHGVSYDPPTGFAGYSPTNKKLLTYPYVAINVTNKRTEGVDYAYEFFINRKPAFYYEGTLSLNPSCVCYPVGYKGKTFAVEEGVTIDSYPLATWGQDGFSEWASNHLFQTVIGIGLAAATNGASAYMNASHDLVGAVQHYNPGLSRKDAMAVVNASPSTARRQAKQHAVESGVGTAVSTIENRSIGVIPMVANSPPPVQGVNAHDLLFGNLYGKRIRVRRKMIRAAFARKIDDYFTRYGYATNEVKVPNLNSRPFWNYIQLNNAHLEDIDCPMDAANTIKGVYEKGVTFWRPTAKIGDYANQDNSV